MIVLVIRDGGQAFPLMRVSVFVMPSPDQIWPLLPSWLSPKHRSPMQIAIAMV